MIFFFLFTIVVAFYDDQQKPKCWRGGHYNSTTETCDCIWGWKNVKNPGGVCSSKSCGLGEGPDFKDRCLCPQKEFNGLNCELCLSDAGCQDAFNQSGCRPNELISFQNMKFECNVHEAPMIALIGSKTTFQTHNIGYGPDNGFPNVAYLQAWSFNDTNGFEGETFWCNLYNCTMTLEPDHGVSYACLKSWCECNVGKTGNDRCNVEPEIRQVVANMRGPAHVICKKTGDCQFKHHDFPATVLMSCTGAECSNNFTKIPKSPKEPPNYALFIFIGVSFVMCMCFCYICCIMCCCECYLKVATSREYTALTNFGACGGKVEFENLCYYVAVWKEKACWKAKHQILYNLKHTVYPGEVVAIMGASGAGKTTLLDILAHRNKTGYITGSVLFNDKEIGRSFKRMTGYVQQEDCLMGTMTVYECVRFSADLRLPTCVPGKEKKRLCHDILKKLRISHIANRYIGDQMTRGVSGGERKRVSIATEMVINPHVLFLDEPTSGLDASSAYLIIKRLFDLAKEEGRTMIFSIHQPRSNIYALFDDLILLSKGRKVYAGKAAGAVPHFQRIGHDFPKNANPADWLIDIVTDDEQYDRENVDFISLAEANDVPEEMRINEQTPIMLKEPNSEGVIRTSTPVLATFPQPKKQFIPLKMGGLDGEEVVKISEDQTISAMPGSIEELNNTEGKKKKKPRIPLYDDVERDEDGAIIIGEGEEPRKIWGESMIPYATPFFKQFYILSWRAFYNFIRNFYLAPAHLISALIIGLLIGMIYWQEQVDIAGCQNRLGSIFFMMCLLSFTAMSGLEIFIRERPIYVRERANGYYYPMAYYVSKVIFDIIPLRVIPPFIMTIPAGLMIGLRSDPFWKFCVYVGLMVLFNVIAGAVCIMIGTIAPTVASANITATLVILTGSLFAGFLLNHASTPKWLVWLKYLSYWNYAFEAFVVNELVGVRVTIDPIGLPAYLVYKTDGRFYVNELGMTEENYLVDIIVCAIFAVVFLIASGFMLQCFVREKR